MPTELERWGARIRYQAEFSEKYHVDRSVQLLRWKLGIQYIAIASGLPAVSLLTQTLKPNASLALTVILGTASVVVALLTILDQVYKFSDRSTEHRLVAQQYTDIAKELRSKKLCESDLERIQSRMDGLQIIEALQPELVAKSHNALMNAYDFGSEYCFERGKGSWLRAAFGQLPSLKPSKNLAADEDAWVEKLGVKLSS